MKRIAVVTGSRAEYDILYSSMKAIREHKRLRLNVIVTGAHLLGIFGDTYREIKKDGFSIDERVPSALGVDTLAGRARAVGAQVTGLSAAFERLRPDIVLVAGDREEVISAAVAASYMNIPIAHMCGGDTAFGSVDNAVRDAATKLTHIHLPMTGQHALRIIKMGEEKRRVHVVGHGGLDRLITEPFLSKKALSRKLRFGIEPGPVIFMIQHVLSSEIEDAARQIAATLEAVAGCGYKLVINYPNSDVGSRTIINTIKKYENDPGVRVYKNLPRRVFVNLLRHANVLIGNSSCGIIEAPLLKLPVVNIGNRQRNRLHAENVIFVGHDKRAIARAVRKAVSDKAFLRKVRQCRSPYGDGHTGKRVAAILDKTAINSGLLNKPNL
jgi:GDP/UDP-N,N'-diacetylbacillosamine 2-epimerase (hydrolysing)